MKKPTISLCMIVRDEAETLRDAIECVKPLCDEIVIGIDISARVQSKKVDLLEPWKTEYEIDNFEDRLPKTLRNEARRNNRLNRNIGNLMGRRVDDRKLSDSGLAVNKRELRILG